MKYSNVYTNLCMLTLMAICSILPLSSIACADDTASQLANHFLNKTAAPDLASNVSLNQAMEIQTEFLSLISKTYGTAIGYKAGLTNTAVQEKFGVSHPLRGTLLEKMLLQSGAEIESNFGIRPLHEGDLILRVSDAAINQAESMEDVLKYINAVIPFIELPDIPYAADVKINAANLAAVNVAARFGVMGDPILLEATGEWMDRLQNFKLEIIDEQGTILAEGSGKSLLGHPLNVVLWIKDSLVREGKSLKKGDLLSLGTVTKLLPAKPGKTIRAVYTGLSPEGPVEASVKFK